MKLSTKKIILLLLTSSCITQPVHATSYRIENKCSETMYAAPFDGSHTYGPWSIDPGSTKGTSSFGAGSYFFVSLDEDQVDHKNVDTVDSDVLQTKLTSNGMDVITPGRYFPGDSYKSTYNGSTAYVLPVSCDDPTPEPRSTITTVTFSWHDIEANSSQMLSSTMDLLTKMLSTRYSEYEHISTTISQDESDGKHDIAIKFHDTSKDT